MINLYTKNRIMFRLSKRIFAKMLIWFSVFLWFFVTYSFAQTRLYFSPWNIYPILNVNTVYNTGVLKIHSDGVWVSSYWVDVHNQSELFWEVHPNNKLKIITNLYAPSLYGMTMSYFGQNNSREYNSNLYKVWEFAWNDNTSIVGLVSMNNQDIGALFVSNSWYNYLTSAYIGYFVSGTNSTTRLNWNAYDQLSWLNIYFWAAPAQKDTVQPSFPNNQVTVNINPNFPDRQLNRQNKDDFSWIFSLLDNSNTSPWSNGWIGEPDFDVGSNFRPNAANSADSSITNQNGINTWSFRLEIKVATGWLSQSTQTSWSNRWTSVVYTNNSAGITLVPWSKTWRWLDKNYTWQVNISNIPDFGVEQLVMISGRVEDRDMWYPWFNWTQTWDDIKWYSYRSGKNNTGFVYYFNQGMRPWFNTGIQWSYTHTPICILDLDRYQTGFAIKNITGFLHDDWAGIDVDSIQVIVTWTIAWTIVAKTYTVSDVSNVDLLNFSFNNTWCRNDTLSNGNTASAYPGNGTTDVCNTSNYLSTGNYRLVFGDLARTYDPETRLDVSIIYKDKVNKNSWPVSCGWWVAKAPRFVWTWWYLSNFLIYFSPLVQLSNYPNGAQILPIDIQLQDDWAWVDTGAIFWSISGQKLTAGLDGVDNMNIDLSYNNNIYTQVWWSNLWSNMSYPNYTSWNSILISQIQSWQQLNYELFFAQTWSNSNFTWYFAPEHPINLTLTFNDRQGSGVSNPINVTYTNSEAPVFRDYTKEINFTGWVDQKLNSSDDSVWIYLTGQMVRLFSGNIDSWENRVFPYDLTWDNMSEIWIIKQTQIAFKVTDNRAWVDSGTVKVTVQWKRWWTDYTYVFTGISLSFLNFLRWDNWNNALNYLVQLTDHDIYFDRQSRWWSAPVPGRESRYTITLEADDLKKPVSNKTSISFTRDMENLSCQYLDRCNARLYFTHDYNDWSGVVPIVATWVHPFLWQTLYVIASGNQIIYTGVNQNYIACNGAGSLWSSININFQVPLASSEINPYNNYQHTELVVVDGEFELVGWTLVLR